MKRFALVIVVLGLLAVAIYFSPLRLTGQSDDWIPAEGSVILISLDTLRADMLNTYGYEEYPTSPFLDSFADENILFENSIVQEPRTLTSHMSLLTGLYPHHHGVQDDFPLPAGIPTVQMLLSEQGYRTQGFVDDGYLDRRWGFDRGFDGYVDDHRRGLEYLVPRAIKWLKANADKPVFLFLHTYDVHSEGLTPYYPSPAPFGGMFSDAIGSDLSADRDEYERQWEARKASPSDDDKRFIKATYADGIRHVDDQLERFFDYLKESGLYDRALIIVWSDHGEGLLDHDDWTHDELYDHTIRGPLILRTPTYDGPGKRVSTVVSSIDIMPAILDYVSYPSTVPMDGTSLLDFISNEDEKAVAYTIRAKDNANLFSIRTPRYHLMWNGKLDKTELYDLEVDPREKNNLYPSGREIEVTLHDMLFKWIESYERDRVASGPQGDFVLDPEIERKLRALGYLK